MYFLSTNKVKADASFEELDAVIPRHIEWINNQISTGNIVQAGKWGTSGGMSIINAKDIMEAEKLLQEDPLVKSGLVTYELDEFCPHVAINQSGNPLALKWLLRNRL